MSAAWIWFAAFVVVCNLLMIALGGNHNLAKENRRLRYGQEYDDLFANEQARRAIALRQDNARLARENAALRARVAEVEDREPPHLSEVRLGLVSLPAVPKGERP